MGPIFNPRLRSIILQNESLTRKLPSIVLILETLQPPATLQPLGMSETYPRTSRYARPSRPVEAQVET